MWLCYHGVVTLSLTEFLQLSGVDRALLYKATLRFIDDLNEKGGGTLTGAPPRRER